MTDSVSILSTLQFISYLEAYLVTGNESRQYMQTEKHIWAIMINTYDKLTYLQYNLRPKHIV